MYPFHHSGKTLVIMLVLGFLGSILLSEWKGEFRSAQAYFSPEDAPSINLSSASRDQFLRDVKDASIESTVVEVKVSAPADDAEQRVNDGFMYLDSSDLELVYDPGVIKAVQSVGMRFNGLNIPPGAIITQAYVEFEVDEASSEATSLVFYGQAADNAGVFTTGAYNITSRARTATSASWNNVSSWNTVGAKVQSPDLSAVIQEIINRPGWASGNSLVLIVEGSGRRVSAAYEAGGSKAPLLHVVYELQGSTPTPPPPTSTPTPTTQPPSPTPSSTPPPPTSTPVSTSQLFVIDARVSTKTDDAEQRLTDGRMYLTSSDLELVYDSQVAKANQSIGLRFNSIDIPQGATITQAYLELTVDEPSTESTSLVLYGQASDNAVGFSRSNYNVTSREKTTTFVSWNNVPAWTVVGSRVQSPDLTGVIQEIVNRNGWVEGNSLAIIMDGSGTRVAAAYEASSLSAPLLHVVYSPIITTSTPTPPASPPTSTPTPPPNSDPTPVGQDGNWTMVFGDEFNGSVLDTTKWRTCFWWADVTCTIESNNEMELYNPEDVLVQNGLLRLRAQKRDMVAWNGTTYHYTSGMVMTGGRGGSHPTPPGFTFLYGYAEALVKVPAGQGLWPAFWTLSMSYNWPPEIDIMEILGHQPDVYHMNYHYSGGNAGTSWNGPDFSAGWHVLGMDWEPDAIVWYVDGIERWRFTDAAHITDEVSYLLLNLAVGGDWPGPPDATTPFPSYYDIDYVRVWQR